MSSFLETFILEVHYNETTGNKLYQISKEYFELFIVYREGSLFIISWELGDAFNISNRLHSKFDRLVHHDISHGYSQIEILEIFKNLYIQLCAYKPERHCCMHTDIYHDWDYLL